MNKSTFCVLSYVGTDIDMNGFLVPCCNYEWHDTTTKKWHMRQYHEWKTHGLRELQQDLDSGRRHPNCSKCWHHEDQGIFSYRQAWNEQYAGLIEQGSHRMSPITKLLHIEFDNYCNIKCIMCHPGNSSSLAAEVHRHQDVYKDFFEPLIAKDRWYETNEWKLLRDQLLPQIDYIMFTGGEPLISPYVIDFIDHIPDRSKIGLRVTTNATVATKKIMSLFQEFNSVDIGISLEGIGAHNDLLRHGSDWATVESNLWKFQNLDNHIWGGINIGHVFTHTSAWALPPLMRYCIKHNLNIHINPLFGQDWLHPRGMSLSTRSYLIDQLLSVKESISQYQNVNFAQQINGVIQQVNSLSYDSECEQKFWQYIDLLDRLRSTDFRKTMSNQVDFD